MKKKIYLSKDICIRREKNPADTNISEVEGGGAPVAGAEIPLQSVEKGMVKQVVALLPVEDHARGDNAHCSP